MKHLLIILSSILLLSSFLTSCEKETGVLSRYQITDVYCQNSFGWKSKEGNDPIRELISVDRDKQPKYKGEIKNNNPDGKGTSTYPNGDKYVGEWKDGKRHGQGTFSESNGDKYVGSWKDGERHGQGTLTIGKGKWEGKWEMGEYVYGRTRNGGYTGQGTYTWSNGQKYVGKYRSGDMDGQGTLTYGKGKWEGDRYVGELKFGKFNGQGTYTFRDGGKIIGKFIEGKEWDTEHYNKDGKIIGKYINGTRIGEVMFLFHSERNGEWDWYEDGNEEKDGKYVGEIENGKPNGLGKINYSDGTKKVGLWKDGKEWNIEYFKKDGTTLGKYVNGEWKKYFVLFRGLEKTKRSWFKNLFGQNEKSKIIWVEDGDDEKIETKDTGGKYVGEIKNGLPNGQGILTYYFYFWDKYVGEFKDGVRHGQGTEISPDGTKLVGEWKDGKEWNIEYFDMYGNHVYTPWLEGKSNIDYSPEWKFEPLISLEKTEKCDYTVKKEIYFPPKTNQLGNL